jgi:hypothetical protein
LLHHFYILLLPPTVYVLGLMFDDDFSVWRMLPRKLNGYFWLEPGGMLTVLQSWALPSAPHMWVILASCVSGPPQRATH